MNQPTKHLYEFLPFRLDAVERMLLREGERVPLSPKPFDILLVLVQNCGHLVEKNELLQAVWPDSFVEECNLSRNVSTLRRALDDHEPAHRFIETIPRRGYRFVADVREWWEAAAAPLALHPATAHTIGAAAVRSLAVLPFESLNADGGQNSLGLEIADALITSLSNLQLVSVRPTSAVRKYVHSENDAAVIGGELQVESVLEGSIQQTEKRIRVTVQLVSVRDGALLWGAKFDEPFTDIFTVEDSIASQVAGALLPQLIYEGEPLLSLPSSRGSLLSQRL